MKKVLFVAIAAILFIGCQKEIKIYGCTDSTALNYSAISTDDDGSCMYSDNSNDLTYEFYEKDFQVYFSQGSTFESYTFSDLDINSNDDYELELYIGYSTFSNSFTTASYVKMPFVHNGITFTYDYDHYLNDLDIFIQDNENSSNGINAVTIDFKVKVVKYN